MRVQVVSESSFTVGGHGVHSAFLEHVKYLEFREDVELAINGRGNRKVDLVHVHTVGPYSAHVLLSTRSAKVVTAHLVPDSLAGSVVGATWMHGATTCYLSWFYNLADVVIAVSENVRKELLRIGVTRPVTVLPNWIAGEEVMDSHPRREQVRSRLGLHPSDFLVVSVGQVQPRKGVLEFLSIARQLPAVTFLWVGDAIFGIASVERAKLRRALATGPPNVIHVGQVDRSEVYDLLSAGDAYLSTSNHETFGIAALEAAAAGRPLVLSDIPVFRHVYADAALYAAPRGQADIIAALASSHEMCADWSSRAAKIADNYHCGAVGDKLFSLYQYLVRVY